MVRRRGKGFEPRRHQVRNTWRNHILTQDHCKDLFYQRNNLNHVDIFNYDILFTYYVKIWINGEDS